MAHTLINIHHVGVITWLLCPPPHSHPCPSHPTPTQASLTPTTPSCPSLPQFPVPLSTPLLLRASLNPHSHLWPLTPFPSPSPTTPSCPSHPHFPVHLYPHFLVPFSTPSPCPSPSPYPVPQLYKEKGCDLKVSAF